MAYRLMGDFFAVNRVRRRKPATLLLSRSSEQFYTGFPIETLRYSVNCFL